MGFYPDHTLVFFILKNYPKLQYSDVVYALYALQVQGLAFIRLTSYKETHSQHYN